MQIQKTKKVKLHVEREVYSLYIDKFKQAGSTEYIHSGGVSGGGQTC